MVRLNHNHRLVGSLLLVLEPTFLHDLVIDNPVVMDYSAIFALLTRKKTNQSVFLDILFFLYLSLFGFSKEARSTSLLCYFRVNDLTS